MVIASEPVACELELPVHVVTVVNVVAGAAADTVAGLAVIVVDVGVVPLAVTINGWSAW